MILDRLGAEIFLASDLLTRICFWKLYLFVASITLADPSKSDLITPPMDDMRELPPAEIAAMVLLKKDVRPGRKELDCLSLISLNVFRMSLFSARNLNRDSLGF